MTSDASRRRSVVAVEPWYGGSHARFLDAWRARSRHAIEIRGLPARHWKWRMAASAWSLASAIAEDGAPRPDALFVSDYVDLPRLRGFLPREWAGVPTLLYFHENQLTYPGRDESGARDNVWGFANVLSCLSADRIAFNSRYHLESFAAAARELLRCLPRPRPGRELEAALERASVVAPGIDLDGLALGRGAGPGAALRIAFNHRWEHDKAPAEFLRAAAGARDAGAELELVLLGETFESLPEGVEELLEGLRPAIAHRGYAHDRREYATLLAGSDLVVSTARHEFFGLAVVEAMATGCTPLLPDRLSYPGLLPEELHAERLYARDADLPAALVDAAAAPERFRGEAQRRRFRAVAERFDAQRTADELDALVDTCLDPRATSANRLRDGRGESLFH